MAARADTLARSRSRDLGRSSPRPNPRGGARSDARSPRPSRAASLRVVPPPRRAAGRRRLLLATCTVLTVLLAFGVVASHVFVTQNQDRLDRLSRRVNEAQERYEELRFQVAELESPERVVAAAQDRLGMVEPARVNYVTPPAADAASAGEPTVTEAPDWRLVKSELAEK